MGLKTAEGALVAEPQADGPAAKAGIKAGDVIVKVNGDAVKDARTLARRISTLAPGTSVKLTRPARRQGRGRRPDARRHAEGSSGQRQRSGDDREVPGAGCPRSACRSPRPRGLPARAMRASW